MQTAAYIKPSVLVLCQKFLAIQQCPTNVFHTVGWFRFANNVLDSPLHFEIGRQAANGRTI